MEVLMLGDCPKCGQAVLIAGVADVQIRSLQGNQWNGVKYYCMSCQAILSVAIDPIAIKTDIVAEILDALGKG
jgi:hypothetical protein